MRMRPGLSAYFVTAFAIAWTGVLLVAARTGMPARAGTGELQRLLAFLAMIAGPSSASLALTAADGGLPSLRRLLRGLGRVRLGARWYAALLIAPGLLIAVLALLSLASPAYVPPIFRGEPALTPVVFALVAGLGAGLFEELGWTGFATPRLLERYSWWRAGLLLGVIWAVWHTLADYWGGAAYGSLWALHMFEWFVALTAFRVLMTWVNARTRSLPLGMLMHASFTGSQAFLWPAVEPHRELIWYGAFACALWLVVIAVVGMPAHAGPARCSSRRGLP